MSEQFAVTTNGSIPHWEAPLTAQQASARACGIMRDEPGTRVTVWSSEHSYIVDYVPGWEKFNRVLCVFNRYKAELQVPDAWTPRAHRMIWADMRATYEAVLQN